jgi:hypothetical protein
MKAAKRWLLANPDKVPFYINGRLRNGALDGPEDTANLAAYDDARAALAQLPGWFLGFALGPDGSGWYWQGIDLDHVKDKYLGAEANDAPGYVEFSPSSEGIHAVGYGRHFATLGANGTGVEAYAERRYFTVTERPIRDGQLTCLAEFVGQRIAPRHSAARPAVSTAVEVVEVDPKTVTELRSALTFLRADDHEQWVAVGHALRELGEVGRGLWLDWSRTSDKFDPIKDPKKWDGFRADRTGHRAVFKRAQEQGWTNPASNAAQLSTAPREPAPTGTRTLVGRSLGGVQARSIDWLWSGWLPKGYITILAGETGAGKSTILADIAARITTGAAWPGQLRTDTRPPGRVLWLGSEDSIEEMTVPRLMACGANLHNVIEIEGVSQNGKRNTFSMQDDLEEVAHWLNEARQEGLPFAMLVIDPVTSYLPGQRLRKVDLNDAGQLRTILEPWLKLAQTHNIAIVCVTHFAKDTTRSMLHRVLGSAAFAQTCRSLVAVIEPPATDDYEPAPHEKALLQVKVNLPEHPGGAWKFSTERVEVGTDQRNGKSIYATRPNWDELDTALSPKTAVGGMRGPKSQQQMPFAIWLKGLFAVQPTGTWLPVDQVKWSAIREQVVSENWWNRHSADHLDKQNLDGAWQCRPKAQAT